MTGSINPLLQQHNLPNSLVETIIEQDTTGSITLSALNPGNTCDVWAIDITVSAPTILALVSTINNVSTTKMIWQVVSADGNRIYVPRPSGAGRATETKCFPLCQSDDGATLTLQSSGGVTVTGSVSICNRVTSSPA